MTGPPYPPQPQFVPGSNAIGVFTIGQSPIGSLYSFDIWQTIISQYANSPIIVALIENFQAELDQTANIDAFYDQIMNIDTAVGYGLDVWGRILAVNRILNIAQGPPYFGFQERQDQPFGPGGLGPFFNGEPLTTAYSLDDDGFRVLLLAKAFSNICDGSIPSINRLLQTLFGSSGKSYVVDTGNMTFVYQFEFPLNPLQSAILTQSGVFPKPTGVSYTVNQL